MKELYITKAGRKYKYLALEQKPKEKLKEKLLENL